MLLRPENYLKYNLIKNLEKLLKYDTSCENLTLSYGYYDKDKEAFIPCPTKNIDGVEDPDEVVQIKWGNQDDKNCTYTRINMDSPTAIIYDVMKTLEHWLK